MAVELTNPATGKTITVANDRAAAVHERNGWTRTAAAAPADEPTAPDRPADDAAPEQWIAYAIAAGIPLDPDETIVLPEDLPEFIQLVDEHIAAAGADQTSQED